MATLQMVNANVPPEASIGTNTPLSPSPVYQQLEESGDIASAAQVANEDTDITTSVNPAYETRQNGSDSNQYDYALCVYRPVDS